MIGVGVACIDITPPAGLSMAGYAARTQMAKEAHDALTVRALVVDETALVTVDVIGIDASLSRRARSQCSLNDDAVMILATHTHGGPVSMSGRLAATADPAFLETLEHAIVQAVEQALVARQPARMFGGTGIDPGHARNRRYSDGPVDSTVPVVRFVESGGETIAILTSYACHPVVLGADNLTWTGDYPYYTRIHLEAAYPGSIALFATGCAADVNTGHSAASSLSPVAQPDRSYSRANTIGNDIAQSALDTDLTECFGSAAAANITDYLDFQPRETLSPGQLAEQWQSSLEQDNPIKPIWVYWAENLMGKNLDPLPARCTAFNWCGVQLLAMPGEIFARTALDIRQTLSSSAPLFVLAYADDNPGYIPHQSAYAEGGYEVDEAHRFYGLGATFAPGSAERLAASVCEAARIAAANADDGQSAQNNAT